jgi:transposase
MRGLLQEFGYTIPKGVHQVRQRVLDILSTETALISLFIDALELNYLLLCRLDEQIEQLTQMIERHSRQHPEIKRLQSIPGFGPLVASAFFNAVGDGSGFKRGRDVSAAIGLVPKQHSSGGKSILLGISKRGDGYLRSLVVHGSRAVVAHAAKKSDALSSWINQLVSRRGKHKAIVALANKLTRIAWAVLTTGKEYQADYQFA